MSNICMTRWEVAVALLPCRHASTYVSCIDTVMGAADEDNSAKCPACRGIIQDRLQVFI